MVEIIGQLINSRYRVDSFLGKGAMAEVYKVWDMERNVHLAMKILHADLAEDRVFLRRFKREAETLSTLQHPNIVRFYGIERDGDIVYMLMDYIDGVTLRKEIFQSEEPFSLERILEVMRSVCSALYYAHKLGFVHCDIKPANIMIQKNGNILVADFGISRMTEASTATMVGAGTPAYMSPEQIKGGDPLPQMDIYALGVVLFELLTGGERPFTGVNAKTTGTNGEKVRWEHLRLPPPPPSKFNPTIDHRLDEIVLKCLDKAAENRYLDAMDVYRELLTLDNIESGQKMPVQERQPEIVPTSESVNHVLDKKLDSKNSNANLDSIKELIALARDFEKKGDRESAIKTFEYALFQLPADSSLRREIELTIELQKSRTKVTKRKNLVWVLGVAAFVGLVLFGIGVTTMSIDVEPATPTALLPNSTPIVLSTVTKTLEVGSPDAVLSESTPTQTIIMLKVSSSKIILKAGPDNNHPDLPYSYVKGTEMIVLEKYKEWYYVEAPDGKTGWVHYQWVTIDPLLVNKILQSNNIPTVPPNSSRPANVTSEPEVSYP
jgi:serine/threonine protein kinase